MGIIDKTNYVNNIRIVEQAFEGTAKMKMNIRMAYSTSSERSIHSVKSIIDHCLHWHTQREG